MYLPASDLLESSYRSPSTPMHLQLRKHKPVPNLASRTNKLRKTNERNKMPDHLQRAHIADKASASTKRTGSAIVSHIPHEHCQQHCRHLLSIPRARHRQCKLTPSQTSTCTDQQICNLGRFHHCRTSSKATGVINSS